MLDMENVVIEMDAKLVFDALKGSSRSSLIFGDVIESCNIILGSLRNVSFNCVNRNYANFFAHAFSRNARNFPSPYSWVELPSFVDSLPNWSCTC
ncbi:hypothetical protein ACS0TY_028212 [Phlomoides rotata]